MARVKDIINQWGKQGGPNPQRSDLWQVDLSEVIAGLNDVLEGMDAIAGFVQFVPEIPRYYLASVALPEQKIKAEVIRRDSRSYNMPGFDEPLDAIKMSFVMDDGGTLINTESQASQSTIYSVLNVWRTAVRAGRGSVGSEPAFRLNATYRFDYAFPVYVYLLKGQAMPVAFANSQVTQTNLSSSSMTSTFEGGDFGGELMAPATQVFSTNGFAGLFAQQTGLEVSGILRLEKAWLGGFKMADLSYDRSSTLTVEATLYADNILQIRD